MDESKKYLPWIEKYRPKKMTDIVSHDTILDILNQIIKKGSLPHLLFHGVSGTGKTSTILSVAKKIYGKKARFMVLELNASDDRGISSVRNEIKGFAEAHNMFAKGVKIIILDEADSMTYDAQFALRRIIEEHSITTRFCIICNYLNKIIPALRSRCMIFRFLPIPIKQGTHILKNICKKEKIDCSEKFFENIMYICNGDLRKAINLLQSISLQKSEFTITSGYKIAGLPSPKEINKILLLLLNSENSFDKKLERLEELISGEGYSLTSIIKQIYLELMKRIEEIDECLLEKYLIEMAELEFRLSSSTFDDVYIASLVSIFE